MIRVVVDTNVVVSANLSAEGFSAFILDLAANRKIRMFVSKTILDEYETVLRRGRLKLDPARVRDSLSVILKTSTLVRPRGTLSISDDASDNRFYECAEAAKAHFLITGNTRHFPLSYKFTRIVTPREFVELVVPGLHRPLQ